MRASGELEVSSAARTQTRFQFRTGITRRGAVGGVRSGADNNLVCSPMNLTIVARGALLEPRLRCDLHYLNPGQAPRRGPPLYTFPPDAASALTSLLARGFQTVALPVRAFSAAM